MVPEINLLPNFEGKKSNPVLLFIISAAIILCLLLYLAIQYFSFKSDIIFLASQETQLLAEKEILDEGLLNASTQNKGDLAASVAFVEGVSYAVSPLIDEIDTLLLQHTYLKDYEFSEYDVKIIADFETMTDISIFIERLVKSDYFTDVKIENVQNFDLDSTQPDDNTDFSAIPRYSVELTLMIDPLYVSAGGARP